MLEHIPNIRQQVARERRDRIASDYRVAQRHDDRPTEGRSTRPAPLLRRLWHRHRRHAPAYHH